MDFQNKNCFPDDQRLLLRSVPNASDVPSTSQLAEFELCPVEMEQKMVGDNDRLHLSADAWKEKVRGPMVLHLAPEEAVYLAETGKLLVRGWDLHSLWDHFCTLHGAPFPRLYYTYR